MSRFTAKAVASPSGCLFWQGAKTDAGYPIFTDGDRRKVYAHRWVVEQWMGRRLRRDEHVMHACDNPSCVNVRHLSVGSAADNEQDKKLKGRQAWGERHGMRRLTEDAVRDIVAMRGHVSQKALADKHGISQAHVSKVQLRQSWALLPV
jgi:hypothetical protein